MALKLLVSAHISMWIKPWRLANIYCMYTLCEKQTNQDYYNQILIYFNNQIWVFALYITTHFGCASYKSSKLFLWMNQLEALKLLVSAHISMRIKPWPNIIKHLQNYFIWFSFQNTVPCVVEYVKRFVNTLGLFMKALANRWICYYIKFTMQNQQG